MSSNDLRCCLIGSQVNALWTQPIPRLRRPHLSLLSISQTIRRLALITSSFLVYLSTPARALLRSRMNAIVLPSPAWYEAVRPGPTARCSKQWLVT